MWQAEGMFVCGRLRECLCVAGCGNVCVWQAEGLFVWQADGMFVWQAEGMFVCGRLREWVAKAAEREEERQQRRKERTERRRAVPRHHFNDPDYDRQKTQVTEQLEDALQQGTSH